MEQTEEQKKDFYKWELLKLGYHKHSDGRQLYELEIDELKDLYEDLKHNQWLINK